MTSQTRQREREENRRLNLRTLVIASAASASAATVTSQFWIRGTWIAAALTPVIVTLVSEMLHRPTERIARRMTTEGAAILPDAAGAGAPPREGEDELPARARAEPGSQPEGAPQPPAERAERAARAAPRAGPGAPVRVYRQTAPRGRRKVALGVVALTGVLAFAVAALAITGTELITGGSVGKGDRDTTLFGGGRDRDRDEEEQPAEEPAPEEGEQPSQPEPAPEEPAPRDQPPREPPRTTPEETTPTTTVPPPP